jgi:hypothetical protein
MTDDSMSEGDSMSSMHISQYYFSACLTRDLNPISTLLTMI